VARRGGAAAILAKLDRELRLVSFLPRPIRSALQFAMQAPDEAETMHEQRTAERRRTMTAGAEHRWTRVLFNAGEPTNSLSMWGIEGPDGSVHAVGCRLSGRFNDGPARCAILPNDDGTFAWFNGDEEGTAASFGAAWAEMPAMVAEPDYCEDLDAAPKTGP
jgi:hypothetical protein